MGYLDLFLLIFTGNGHKITQPRHDFDNWVYMGVEPKIGVDFIPKMDGENNDMKTL